MTRTPKALLGLMTAAIVVSLTVTTSALGRADAQGSPIYEIRNYHFDPANFDAYAEVARGEYLRYLREHLDVVGFWIDSGIEAEVRGAPQDELGTANITWIIRWSSMAERTEKLGPTLSTPEWQEIFAEVPGGGASYLRIESRFMESLY